jgi:hypothetical protein
MNRHHLPARWPDDRRRVSAGHDRPPRGPTTLARRHNCHAALSRPKRHPVKAVSVKLRAEFTENSFTTAYSGVWHVPPDRTRSLRFRFLQSPAAVATPGASRLAVDSQDLGQSVWHCGRPTGVASTRIGLSRPRRAAQGLPRTHRGGDHRGREDGRSSDRAEDSAAHDQRGQAVQASRLRAGRFPLREAGGRADLHASVAAAAPS